MSLPYEMLAGMGFAPQYGVPDTRVPVGKAALGDEAAVMMISGLGQDVDPFVATMAANRAYARQAKMDNTLGPPNPVSAGMHPRPVAMSDPTNFVPTAGVVDGAAHTKSEAVPTSMLAKRYNILGIDLPLWIWLLIAAGILSAGWIFLRKRQ